MVADADLGTDDRVGADVSARPNGCRGVNDGCGMDSGGIMRWLVENAERLRKGEVWVGESQGGGGNVGKIGSHEYRCSLGGAGQASVFGVGDEGDFGGRGIFNAANSGDFDAPVPAQLRAQLRCQLCQLHGSDFKRITTAGSGV